MKIKKKRRRKRRDSYDVGWRDMAKAFAAHNAAFRKAGRRLKKQKNQNIVDRPLSVEA